MAAYEVVLLCSLLWILSPAEGKELTITCLSSEDCVLPCQFQSDGKGARVMWYKKKVIVSCTRYGNTSFVPSHNSPAEMYVGRTGLYADQVLEGNATLVLRNVTPNDQGKYFCITMTQPRTDQSGVISLVVKAPVQEVDIELEGDSVTCRAAGIFPAPTLTWSTDPPTEGQRLQNKTKIQKNKLGFYEIQSSLKLKENNGTNQTCVCCVTSDTNRKTASLKHEATIVTFAGSEVKVPCALPHSFPQRYELTWRFRRLDPILSISTSDQKSQVKVWDQWKAHVSNGLSARRGLELYDLKPEHQGSYTCEVSTPEEVYITWTDVTVTEVSKTYIYISIIIILCYFLFVSYGMVAILGFKILRSEKPGERGKSQTEVQEALRGNGEDGGMAAEENAVTMSDRPGGQEEARVGLSKPLNVDAGDGGDGGQVVEENQTDK